ncbi:EFH1 Transcriptional regulator EFH1 [Candida maltosa Xu316]
MNIKSSSGINLANGVNKSRTSSISRSQAGGRQSRAASISSCIPQTEFPDRVVRPKVATTRWDDENTNCYQVRARNILVSRREDTNYINGTKLLNVIGMTRGKRDGILKTEKIKNVVKVGSMNLKGVWIPFDRAYEIARNEGHKLKSEEDEQQQQQQQQQHNIDEDDEDDDDESTSISSSKNSESKLLESNEIIKNIEQGNIESANNPTSGTGDVSTTAATSAGTSASGDVKYVHEYFERSPQSTTLKEEELYYGSTQNTPLSVPKTL